MAKGYVRIDNDLFDFMTSGILTGAELEVMWFLIRYSKGFNRDTARASYSYIAKGMNCSISKVKRAIKGLTTKKYISIEYAAKGTQASVFKIDYSNLTTQGGQNCTARVVKSEHSSVVKSEHQDITEDITNKDNTNIHKNGGKSWDELRQEDFDD